MAMDSWFTYQTWGFSIATLLYLGATKRRPSWAHFSIDPKDHWEISSDQICPWTSNILLELNVGNFREWSIITPVITSNNHPSNPQQPIHSLRLAPVRHTLKQTQLCGWFPLLSLIYSQVMPGRCEAPEYMEARRWTGTSWCNPVVSWSITTIYWFDKSTIINQLHQRTGVPPWKSPLIATPSTQLHSVSTERPLSRQELLPTLLDDRSTIIQDWRNLGQHVTKDHKG